MYLIDFLLHFVDILNSCISFETQNKESLLEITLTFLSYEKTTTSSTFTFTSFN